MLLTILCMTFLAPAGDGSAITPSSREHDWWVARVERIQEVVNDADETAEVVFIGDSITQGWENAGAKVWDKEFANFGAINLGISGDRTEHVLWRLNRGHVEGIKPKVTVVMIGTNNFGYRGDSIEEVYEGMTAVVNKLTKSIPEAHVLLLDIFPRGATFNEMRGEITQVNQALQAAYHERQDVTFYPIGHHFLDDDGAISTTIMPDGLHLSEQGYQIWADAITPTIATLLGRSTGVRPQQPVRRPSNMEPTRPREGQSGPWDHDVHVYRVDQSGTKTQLTTFERAGVPTIGKMKDGRIIAAHQWFPDDENFDKIAVLFSSDAGRTWSEPVPMEFDGLDPQARYPFDPTITILEDGRVRLYFTYMVGSRQFEQATPSISSAISDDGIHFVKEDGIRLAVDDMPVIDCAAVHHKNTWHLISPFQEDNEPKAYYATSKDGLTFKRSRDLELNQSFKWLGCMEVVDDKIVFYGSRHHGGPPSGRGIPTATSSTGSRWRESSSLDVQGADSGVITLDDGSKIVMVTGRAREGTASHNQMQQRQPNQPPQNQRPRNPNRK